MKPLNELQGENKTPRQSYGLPPRKNEKIYVGITDILEASYKSSHAWQKPDTNKSLFMHPNMKN